MTDGKYIRFNRGEVDEKATVRDDVDRIQDSGSLMENMMPFRLGGMQYRPGTQYLGAVQANESHYTIPFLTSDDTRVLLEISQSSANPSVETLRVWIDDAILTRTATTDTIVNGSFATDLSGWTDDDDAAGVSVWHSSGSAAINGNGTTDWGRIFQTIVMTATKRTLRIQVDRAPVHVQIGTGNTTGLNDIFDGWLDRGLHSLTFTPAAGDVTITLENDKKYATRVAAVSFEAAGAFSIQGSFFPDTSTNGEVLPTLRFVQSADTMYLVSDGYRLAGQAYPIVVIQRRANESWSFSIPEMADGPYDVINTTAITLAPAAVGGDTTLTADKPFFTAAHVGRIYQLLHSTTYGRCEVMSITSSTVADVRVLVDFGATTATTDWYEGLWGRYKPGPTALELFDGRLWAAGGGYMVGSVSDAYTAFDQNIEGDSAAIVKRIAFGPVQSVAWMKGGEQMLMGLSNEEVVFNSNDNDDVITPTNSRIRRNGSARGSAPIAPELVDGIVYFVQRALKKIIAIQGLSGEEVVTTDATILHPDILSAGVKRIAYSAEPEPRIYVLLLDGTIRAYLFDKAENVAGWCRFSIGGDGTIEDLCCIPQGDEDLVYMVVERASTRYLERMAKFSEAVGGSSSRHYDSHVVYTSPGVALLTGLDHLEGKTVHIWADGRERGSAVVVSGDVTVPASTFTDVVIGVKHTGTWVSNRLARYIDATVLTDRKRLVRLGLIMKNVALDTVLYGSDASHLDPLPATDITELTAPSDDPVLGSALSPTGAASGEGILDVVRGDGYIYMLIGGDGPQLFVAIGEASNDAVTSPDGITWTLRSNCMSATVNWKAPAYGNGTYVAVNGSASSVCNTSPDGITWTSRALPESTSRRVVFGNGLFVVLQDAAAALGRVATSPDGITWTQRTATANATWNVLGYNDSYFIAARQGTTGCIMKSSDGITWTAYDQPASVGVTSIAYGAGVWVIVASSGTDRVVTSPDGQTWTGRTAAQAISWQSVAFGNGIFVAVASSGTNRVMTSPDGITWTTRTPSSDSSWQSVTFANGIFVAVSAVGLIMTSPDGITWTARTNPLGAVGLGGVGHGAL